MSVFTEKVKELMKRDNISQKELASLSGISESSISRYLSESLQPRMDILINIAKAFNVSVSYLTKGTDGENPSSNAYEETLCVVTRNKSKLDDRQKAQLIKVLFDGK